MNFRVLRLYFVFHFLFHYISLFFKMLKQSQSQLLKNYLRFSKNVSLLLQHKKKEVCLKKLASPSLKNKELVQEYDISEGMINDILKVKDHWLIVNLIKLD